MLSQLLRHLWSVAIGSEVSLSLVTIRPVYRSDSRFTSAAAAARLSGCDRANQGWNKNLGF